MTTETKVKTELTAEAAQRALSFLADSKERGVIVRIYRLSVADADFAAHGWRREHFASEAEADLAEAYFKSEGWIVMRHALAVPTDPAKLAAFLNDERRRGQ